MRVRVSGRYDLVPFAGVALALILIFQQSLRDVLSIATDVERTRGAALLPALLILAGIVVYHLYASGQEGRADAVDPTSEAVTAQARAHEVQQLMAFWQILGRSMTPDALQEAIRRHLPDLSNGADVWVLLRTAGVWQRVTDVDSTRWKRGEIEAIADGVIRESPELLVRPDGIERNGCICYGILIKGRPAGIVGMVASEQAREARRTIGTAATLVGIALRNVQQLAEVRENGFKDSLTGCFNRTHGLERLEAELARSKRSASPLSVLMCDIDRFKQINDEHGHLYGDQMLASIGNRLRQVLRRSDIRCRYGGDEFLIVLPETGPAGASRVAECLGAELEQVEIAAGMTKIAPEVSIGVATSEPSDSVDVMIERADRSLSAAKAAGRNYLPVWAQPGAPAFSAVAH